jgi:uncharacterized protein YndB with AHSA1/START domain
MKTTQKNQTVIKAEPGKQELFVIREFDAPRELVFKAFTDEKLIARWLGPRNLKLRIEKFDPRPGGSYRYIHIDPAGNEFAFHGVIHEMSPALIIQTFEFEGLPEKGHVVLETGRFEELPGGRTRFTNQSLFQSVADRDGMVQAGMEAGVKDSYERLDELIEQGAIK